MIELKITSGAEAQLEEIFAFGVERWGWDQALRYSDALTETFDRIVARDVPWRPVPSSVRVPGFYRRCGSHFVYWRSSSKAVTIVAILHERMQQEERVRDAFDRPE